MSNTNSQPVPSLTVTANPTIGSSYIQVTAPEEPIAYIRQLTEALAQANLKIDAILERVNTPWYKRLYRWFFRRT